MGNKAIRTTKTLGVLGALPYRAETYNKASRWVKNKTSFC
jgi:hypothetical protein